MTYNESEELTKLAEKIRDKCHGDRLDGVQILYLVQDEASEKDGRRRAAQTKMASGWEKFLLKKGFGVEPDFLIIVGADLWASLSKKEREAELDQRLTRCGVKETKDGERRCYKVPYDVQEFHSVVTRRRAWNPDLRRLQQTMAQMPLPIHEEGDAAA